MATITAAMVKELREKTGQGMMDCKKYLQKAEGSLALAEELMRKDNSKVEKKAGRTAADGQVYIATEGNTAAIVEVNSETDFVARGDDFAQLVQQIAQVALNNKIANVEALLNASTGNGSVADLIKGSINKLGENIQLRRVEVLEAKQGILGSYLHGSRIGTLVHLSVDDQELAKDLAMHIAASKPMCVQAEDLPEDVIAKEKEIYAAQAATSGKPANIIEKMVEGRMRKYFEEVTLLGQAFVKNPDIKVQDLVKQKNATVFNFVRFEVGEGIEKKQEDFAKEVEMARGGK